MQFKSVKVEWVCVCICTSECVRTISFFLFLYAFFSVCSFVCNYNEKRMKNRERERESSALARWMALPASAAAAAAVARILGFSHFWVALVAMDWTRTAGSKWIPHSAGRMGQYKLSLEEERRAAQQPFSLHCQFHAELLPIYALFLFFPFLQIVLTVQLSVCLSVGVHAPIAISHHGRIAEKKKKKEMAMVAAQTVVEAHIFCCSIRWKDCNHTIRAGQIVWHIWREWKRKIGNHASPFAAAAVQTQ